jgi:hypothetical protein
MSARALKLFTSKVISKRKQLLPRKSSFLRAPTTRSPDNSGRTKNTPDLAFDRKTNGPSNGNQCPVSRPQQMAQLVSNPLYLPHRNRRSKVNETLFLVGNLLKGPVDEAGKLKDAALMVGIKHDLEAEVHLTVRIRCEILAGLY